MWLYILAFKALGVLHQLFRLQVTLYKMYFLFLSSAMWPRETDHREQIFTAGVSTGANEGYFLLTYLLHIAHNIHALILTGCVKVYAHAACRLVWICMEITFTLWFTKKTKQTQFSSLGSDISHSRWRDLWWRGCCLLFGDVAAYCSGEPVGRSICQ